MPEIIVGAQPAHGTYRSTTSVKPSSKLKGFPGQLSASIQYPPGVAISATTWITVDPEVRGGVPCVGVNRWPVSRILERLASGASIEDITAEFAGLTSADIQTALEIAAWVLRDPAIDWPTLDLPGMIEYQREMRDWESLSDDALGGVDSASGD